MGTTVPRSGISGGPSIADLWALVPEPKHEWLGAVVEFDTMRDVYVVYKDGKRVEIDKYALLKNYTSRHAVVSRAVAAGREWRKVDVRWPRTEEQRIARMDKFVAWKRRKVREKWLIRGGLALGGYFALGLLIVAITYLHRLVFHVVLE